MKAAINLLPPEILEKQFKKAKFYKIQIAGVVIVLMMVFLTSVTLALRVLQGQQITEVSAKVNQTQQRIAGLKNTQADLVLLSDRLKAIESFWGVSSKQTSMYKLVTQIIPANVTINSITVGQTGEISFTVIVPDANSVDNLIAALTTKESNGDKIKEVSIDNLNKSRDGLFRASFKIKPK